MRPEPRQQSPQDGPGLLFLLLAFSVDLHQAVRLLTSKSRVAKRVTPGVESTE
jgi:hypothetical protein